jgi:hypothetical protein
MNAPCKYDDRLLDYLYEEMSGKDAAEFAAHVQGCALCQKNLAGFRRVRSAMSEAAAPEKRSEEALARLTAQVLQQVAKPPAGMGTRTLGSTQNLPSAEMGKVLPLRRRGRLASMLFHPASPIVAMAAAALVFVMWRQQQGPLVQPERLEPPATLSPAPGSPPAGPPPAATPPKEQAPLAAAEQDTDKGKDTLARGPMKPAGAPMARPAAPVPMDTALASEESEKKVLPKARERAEAKLADDLDGLDSPVGAGRRKAEAQDPSASAAPAAEPRAPATAGSAPESAGRFAQPPQAAPPPPVVQQAPRRDARPSPAQADRGASELQEGAETMKQAVQRSQRAALEGALNGNKDKNQDEAAAALLKQMREHLREGRCREAGETLNQLEQKFHGTEVPVEDRLALQRCGQQQEFEAPAQMPEMATRRRAAPPPAKAAKAKAAPPQRGKAADKATY